MIASQVLLMLGRPVKSVIRRMRALQANRYQLMRELFPTEKAMTEAADREGRERLHAVVIPEDSYAVGRTIGELGLPCSEIQALVHDGSRLAHPGDEQRLSAGDALILFGTQKALAACETRLNASATPPETVKPARD